MTTSFRLNEVPRRSAADVAFEQLAGGILRGELAVGEPLPSERELAEQLMADAEKAEKSEPAKA